MRKNVAVAAVLAFFGGSLGLHKFYLGEWKKGLVYLIFFWTGIPGAVSLIEAAKLLTENNDENSNDTNLNTSSDITKAI